MDSGLYLPTDEVLQFQSFVQQIIDSMKFAFSFFSWELFYREFYHC